MCKIITAAFLSYYFSNVSAYGLVLIALERARAVRKFSVTTLNNSSKRRTWLLIVLSWIIPFAVDAPGAFYLLEHKNKDPPIIGNHCKFLWAGKSTLDAKVFSGVVLAVNGLIPMGIFVLAFSYISNRLEEEEKRSFEVIRGETFNDGYRYYNCWQMVKRRQKTVKVLIITSAVYVVCWIPDKSCFSLLIMWVRERNTPISLGILLGTKVPFS